MKPEPIDPIALTMEIGETVAEFNRLANLAGETGLIVQAEIMAQAMVDQPGPRPVLMVNVVKPV